MAVVLSDTATVVVGDTLRLAATATDANGQVVTGVEFVWASADTSVAAVDSTGLVTGVGAGQAEVTATAEGGTGRAELVVVTPSPTTIAVTPDTVVLRDLALESLIASGTNLCVPLEPAFEEWLVTISKRRIAVCGEAPAAYLMQTVQSRAHPVPLVAGEEALLRVFVTAAMATTEGLPDVRARFYLNGSERNVADIAASSTPIPTDINEGDLSKSANAEIPGRIVQPGLEMVIEIDPGGRLAPGLGVSGRIPEEGRLAVEVREMPALDLTVIPFLWSSDPDSAIIGRVEGMAADPYGHALLEGTLREARGRVGGGGGVILRLRVACPTGLGGRACECHVVRPRRHCHARGTKRHPHGHPA